MTDMKPALDSLRRAFEGLDAAVYGVREALETVATANADNDHPWNEPDVHRQYNDLGGVYGLVRHIEMERHIVDALIKRAERGSS